MGRDGRSQELGLFVLRVLIGLLIVGSHGWPKLSQFAQLSGQFGDPLGVGSQISLSLAIFAEFFCGLLLVIGIGTRLAAIPLLITMLVAAFIVHGGDPFQKQEFALLYAIPFLSLLIAGGGSFALGKKIPALRKWS